MNVLTHILVVLLYFVYDKDNLPVALFVVHLVLKDEIPIEVLR